MDKLRVGEAARVRSVSCSGAMRRRFFDLGIIEGATVKKVSKSPLGDPSCYLVNGAMVAIRNVDAKKVSVEKN